MEVEDEKGDESFVCVDALFALRICQHKKCHGASDRNKFGRSKSDWLW